MMYHQGKGVAQDHEEDVRWLRKAAEQGHAKAQLNLSMHYDTGTGVPRNRVIAYMWMSLAAAAGENTDAQRFLLEMSMTPEEIAQAKALAQQWRKIEHATSPEGLPPGAGDPTLRGCDDPWTCGCEDPSGCFYGPDEGPDR